MVAGFFHGDSRAKYNLTEPTPLQGEHVAFEFVVEPFRPSGPSIRTMKTSAHPREVVLTPAVSPITGRLVEGGSVLFLPVHAQRTCPLTPFVTAKKKKKK